MFRKLCQALTDLKLNFRGFSEDSEDFPRIALEFFFKISSEMLARVKDRFKNANSITILALKKEFIQKYVFR